MLKEEYNEAEDFDRLEILTEDLEKWMQTPSGGSTSAGGQDISWDAVKEKLTAIIENEDKHNPLSDDEIVIKLKEEGIEIAPRTVRKYRKILNIASARQRCQL